MGKLYDYGTGALPRRFLDENLVRIAVRDAERRRQTRRDQIETLAVAAHIRADLFRLCRGARRRRRHLRLGLFLQRPLLPRRPRLHAAGTGASRRSALPSRYWWSAPGSSAANTRCRATCEKIGPDDARLRRLEPGVHGFSRARLCNQDDLRFLARRDDRVLRRGLHQPCPDAPDPRRSRRVHARKTRGQPAPAGDSRFRGSAWPRSSAQTSAQPRASTSSR